MVQRGIGAPIYIGAGVTYAYFILLYTLYLHLPSDISFSLISLTISLSLPISVSSRIYCTCLSPPYFKMGKRTEQFVAYRQIDIDIVF